MRLIVKILGVLIALGAMARGSDAVTTQNLP